MSHVIDDANSALHDTYDETTSMLDNTVPLREFLDEQLARVRENEIIGLASIAVPPNDPLEQYLLDHENDMFMNERREIDEVFFKQELFETQLAC